MMKISVCLLFVVMQLALYAQSSITVGAGALITIGTGANISAGSKTGSFTGGGTFNGFLLNEPNASTSLPTNVSQTSVTLNAAVSPQGFSTSYYFSYGTDPASLTTNTETKDAGSGSSSVNVSEDLSGLNANSIYYYKVTATNTNGTTVSDTRLFFTSSSIPRGNLVLWLRADKGITSTGGSVSEWSDLSSNNNKAEQSNSSNQPTIVADAINSNYAVRFNGTSNYLTLPFAQTIGVKDNPYEVFIVAKSSSSNIQFLLSGTTIEQFEYHLNGPGVRFIPKTAVYLDKGSSGDYTDGNAHVFSARTSSSGGAVRIDGVDGGTTANNILSSSEVRLKLGYRGADASYYLNGDIAEVLIYNTTLNSTDRNTVELYLAGRYGITSGALPVELTSFTAKYVDGKVFLNWKTATEVNNYGFNVESRTDNGEWETIGFVQGHGNSNSPKNYSFTQLNPSGGKIEYRLKQIDFDGKFEYSTIEEVIIEILSSFELKENYPEPFNPNTKIDFTLPKRCVVKLDVFNILGENVAELVNSMMEAGKYSLDFNAKKLTSGVYYYKLEAEGFIQVKKMLLIK